MIDRMLMKTNNCVIVQVLGKDMDRDTVMLFAARASRVENQDAIDASIVGMLADPKEARAGIQEVHFLPFNPVDKRTAITYIDSDGKWHRASKGAPEQVLHACTHILDNNICIHIYTCLSFFTC